MAVSDGVALSSQLPPGVEVSDHGALQAGVVEGGAEGAPGGVLSGLGGGVVVSPPEVGGEQLVIRTHSLHVLCRLLNTVVEIFKVDVGVFGSNVGHVGTIEDYGDHVVIQDLPELLRHVVRAQGVLQG